MASSLVGLFKKLSWSDYPVKQGANPGANVTSDAAATAVDVRISGLGLEGDAPSLTLRDSITVTIALKPGCYRYSWVSTKTAADQAKLLAHEQGHYDLSALLGRDFFLALMALKANTYASSAAMQNDLNAAQRATTARSQEISDAYDAATSHGSNATAQAKWLGYIKKAFTVPASNPADTTPDGTTIKVRIVDVLTAANEI